MPAPANNDELLDFVAKSGVVEEPRLRSYMARLAETSAMPARPEELSAALVRDGLITSFQAEHLMQGKWKRFFLGKYKVLEKLGTGGMGTVFLCEHTRMKRRVAVKVLPAAKAQDEASLQRFYREARAVASVDHPNLVRAYDIDEDEGLHFLVMEFVDGINLQDLIKRFGPLDVLRACHYIYGSAVGLHHASQMGLVHRDIKPANILVERTGVVKILDMGLARFFNPDEDDLLTKKFDENVLGTADYLAPEQAIDSSTVDIRADIYGLGATFYFLLVGQPPFPDGTVAQKLLWHQTKMPRPVTELRPEVPVEISNLIARMLAKDLNERVQSPAELITLLTPWVQTPIPPPQDREMPQLSLAALGGATQAARTAGSSLHGNLNYLQPSVAGGKPHSDVLRDKAVGTQGVEPLPTGPPASDFPPTVSRPTPAAAFSPAAFVPAAVSPVSPAPVVPAAFVPAAVAPTVAVAPAAATETEANPESIVWESATSTDTLANALADTSRRTSEEKDSDISRRKSAKTQIKKKQKPFPLLLLLGAAALFLVVLGVAGGIYLLTRTSTRPVETPPTSTQPTPREPQRWIVAASGTGTGDPKQIRKSLSEALDAAGPGDTIAIADAEIQSGPIILMGAARKNLRIEAAVPGTPVKIVYKPLPNSKAASLVELRSTEGVVFNQIVLDVGGQLDYGVIISGRCPDARLDDITVQGARNSGFRLQLVAGDADRPVRLSRFRVTPKPGEKPYENGVLIFADPRNQTQNVKLSEGRLEGPAKAGVRLEGPCQNIAITQAKFFNLDLGVHVAGLQNSDFGMTIERCTFCDIRNAGVMLDAGVGGPKQDLQLTKNYFTQSKELVNTSPGAVSNSVVARENARDPGSNEGNVPIAAKVIPTPPGFNKNTAAAEFLKAPPGSPLAGHGAD